MKKRNREERTERRLNVLEQQREELGVEEFDDFGLLLRLPADIVGTEGVPQRVVLAYGAVVDFGEQVRLQREERLVAGGARSSGDPRLEEVHILFVRFPHPVNELLRINGDIGLQRSPPDFLDARTEETLHGSVVMY